jgi:hypothetical protein
VRFVARVVAATTPFFSFLAENCVVVTELPLSYDKKKKEEAKQTRKNKSPPRHLAVKYRTTTFPFLAQKRGNFLRLCVNININRKDSL